RARPADDLLALSALARDPELCARATTPAAMRLHWDVCQVPDFRKVMAEEHAQLLRRVFMDLTGAGRLAEDWAAQQIDRLDTTVGDIDTLTARIAHVRTWTYISYRPDWLADAAHWQSRTREIEDRLSDALHERLTNRFVDRHAAIAVARREDRSELLAGVTADGTVVVEGHTVGHVRGLAFEPDASLLQGDARPVLAAARRALAQDAGPRVARLIAAPDADFDLLPDGAIAWCGIPVGKLAAGEARIAPRAEVLRNDLLDNTQRESVRLRLAQWLEGHLRRRLKPLYRALDAGLSGPLRGLVFQLSEGLGTVPRPAAAATLAALAPADRRALARLGIRIGGQAVFFPALLKPAAIRLRALLWTTAERLPPAPLPAALAAVLPSGLLPPEGWDCIGYRLHGQTAMRLDGLEALVREAHRLAQKSPFAPTPDLLAMAGGDNDALDDALRRSGFRTVIVDGETRYRPKGRKAAARGRDAPRPSVDPESPFARLRDLVPAK
ncbi:MAG: disulfide oxidoreductase, partial [Alphaproteobacteria bacterium]